MNLKEKLATLPKKPGCYLMKDKDGKIIYVGKAVVLKNRVNSYFIGAHDYKTTKLVSNICDFDYIVTKSEKEALILEYNLIKEYDPYYNIVFKDDKSYPYLLLKDCPEPALAVVRLKKKTRYKGKLYGPYPDVTAARNMLALINKLYPLRKCENGGHDLCLYYHIKECLGYCRYGIEEAVSIEIKNKIDSFINGDVGAVIKDLHQQMDEATMVLDFEKAAYYRDLINDVKQTTQRQNVQTNTSESFDIFNYAVCDSYVAITGLFIKKGKLLASDKYLNNFTDNPEDIVTSYIYHFYQINDRPKKLYVPKELLVFLADAFSDMKILTVNRGKKYQFLKQAKTNCEEYLRQNKEVSIRKKNYRENIANALQELTGKDISRIEIFDNSHTAGKQTVGAMVVYKDFKPSKSDYRLFKLEEGADDLASMKEMLYRRYFRVLKDDLEKPDLILIDGGENQVAVARTIIEALNLDIIIMGLAKNEKHNTAALIDQDGHDLCLDNKSEIFFFLAQMQDEVHRFAITYHQKRRNKAVYNSILDDVKGLGPKYRNRLLKEFHSIANIKAATFEQLQTIIPKDVAQRLYNKIEELKNVQESQ